MAKASKCYTGGKFAVGTPTLNRNMFNQQIRLVRQAKEQHGIGTAKTAMNGGKESEGRAQ